MFESYYKKVNTNSLEEAFKTIYSWLDQNCGLSSMRRDVTESLTVLSTNTNVLLTPQTLPTEAMEVVRYQNHHQQQHQSLQSNNILSNQLIMPPTPTPSATSMLSTLSNIPAATSSSSHTPTPPMSTMARSHQQHSHQQLQQFQISQQVQSTSQNIQTHPIRSVW